MWVCSGGPAKVRLAVDIADSHPPLRQPRAQEEGQFLILDLEPKSMLQAQVQSRTEVVTFVSESTHTLGESNP